MARHTAKSHKIRKVEILVIQILICDDDICMASDIEKFVMTYCKMKSLGFDIDTYYSGDRIIKDLEERVYFDILFLDIEMKKMDGVMVGHYIREQLHNDSMLIIYISSYTQYAMELFQIRPMDFLVKPISPQRMYEVLDIAVRLLNRKEISFSYKQGRNFNKILVKEIIYFRAKDREVEMITTNGVICFYEVLGNIYQVLKDHGFFFIHKSYLVNYDYVDEFYYDRLIMVNGECLKIAQGRRKDVRKYQIEMLCGEMNDGN